MLPVSGDAQGGRAPVSGELRGRAPISGDAPGRWRPTEGELPERSTIAGEPQRGRIRISVDYQEGQLPISGQSQRGRIRIPTDPQEGQLPISGQSQRGRRPVYGTALQGQHAISGTAEQEYHHHRPPGIVTRSLPFSERDPWEIFQDILDKAGSYMPYFNTDDRFINEVALPLERAAFCHLSMVGKLRDNPAKSIRKFVDLFNSGRSKHLLMDVDDGFPQPLTCIPFEINWSKVPRPLDYAKVMSHLYWRVLHWENRNITSEHNERWYWAKIQTDGSRLPLRAWFAQYLLFISAADAEAEKARMGPQKDGSRKDGQIGNDQPKKGRRQRFAARFKRSNS